MARATTTKRDALIAEANSELARLFAHIEDLGAADALLGDAYSGRRTADILTHLTGWHVLLEGWLDEEAAGRVPHLPAPGRSWDDLDQINEEMWAQYRHLSFTAAALALQKSHVALVERLKAFGEDNLYSQSAHPWAGPEKLAGIAHECLGAHYRWGMDVLDRWDDARDNR